jgi:WG containing repeat
VLRRLSVEIMFVLALSTSLAFAQSSPAGRDEAAKLLPIGKALLRSALAAGDRPPSGVISPVSFPLPMCGFSGGLCGAVNRDGTLAVAPEYDWVDSFRDGRAVVRSGGLYGYVDTSGRVIAKPQYRIAGRFSHGFAQVDVGGRSGLIDLEGKTAAEPRYGFVVPFSDQVFWASEGRSVSDGPPGTEQFNFDDPIVIVNGYTHRHVGGSGKWGLVDRSGAWLRPPQFSGVRFFDPANTSLMLAKTDTGWGVIKPDGSWQIRPKFQQIGQLVDGLAVAQIDGRWGFVDDSGQVKIEPKFDQAYGFAASSTMTAARVNNEVGLIDRSGSWIVQPQYDAILPGGILIPKSWWRVKIGNRYGLLDATGRLVISPWFEQSPRRCDDGRILGMIDGEPHLFTGDGTPIEPTEGKLWYPVSCDLPHIVKVGDKFAYADRNLSLITPPKFDKAGGFAENRLAAASIDGKFGLLKPDGDWAIKPTLQAVSSGAADGTVLAKDNDRFGMLNVSSGSWLTPRFDGICSIGAGLIMAQTGGKRGILNEDGAWMIEPNYTRIGTHLEDGMVPALIGAHWGFVDDAGRTVIDAKYEEPSFFDRGVNWVKRDNSWCPIDRRGGAIAGLRCESSNPTEQHIRLHDCKIGP